MRHLTQLYAAFDDPVEVVSKWEKSATCFDGFEGLLSPPND